ncbi:PhytanoylCoA dioxygenase (PhyH) superfamily protein [Balamuthia mandrillaris]
MNSISEEADREYALAKRHEALGDMPAAIRHYKRAERLGHDLREPHQREQNAERPSFSNAQLVEANEEREDRVHLSKEELNSLARRSKGHATCYLLSEEQKQSLEEDGYVVLKGVVEKELCERMKAELFERADKFCGVEAGKFETWTPLLGTGFLDVSWHNPAYYSIRQHPVLYSVFAQLLNEHDLTVSLDRASLKPPAYVVKEVVETQPDGRETKTERRIDMPEPYDFLIHNDMNLWQLQETKYQGGLALSDCPIGGGGFRCIPGFHKLDRIRDYRHNYERGAFDLSSSCSSSACSTVVYPPPEGTFVYFLDQQLIRAQATEIPMEIGDFIVWNSRLPHSNCPNRSANWRVQCFVRFVSSKLHPQYREEVRRCMRNGERPRWYSTGGEVGDYEHHPESEEHHPPKLSWLGKRILGERDWDEEGEEEKEKLL